MRKDFVIGSGLFISLCLFVYFFTNNTVKPTRAAEYSATSVMITRNDGRSGGTGVIISSTRSESKILTNKHVCNVIKNGGLVRSDNKKAVVKYYQESINHDLCLITVNSNFKINTVLANEEPKVYDDAIVSGHPHLLPNIVTYGHFSQKELIEVMTGTKECTEEDMNGENGIYCALLGGIPIIKQYEAQIVSATIMPGSSGSAVFNNKGELSGLVFAGSGEFGYAMIVPFEYIANFFDNELSLIKPVKPVAEGTAGNSLKNIDVKQLCLVRSKERKINNICDLINKSLLLIN